MKIILLLGGQHVCHDMLAEVKHQAPICRVTQVVRSHLG